MSQRRRRSLSRLPVLLLVSRPSSSRRPVVGPAACVPHEHPSERLCAGSSRNRLRFSSFSPSLLFSFSAVSFHVLRDDVLSLFRVGDLLLAPRDDYSVGGHPAARLSISNTTVCFVQDYLTSTFSLCVHSPSTATETMRHPKDPLPGVPNVNIINSRLSGIKNISSPSSSSSCASRQSHCSR